MPSGSTRTTIEAPRGETLANHSILHRQPRIGTALVGYGYWGPNLARNIDE